MADESKPPQLPSTSETGAPEKRLDAPRAQSDAPPPNTPRTDDKSPSPGFASTDAGELPSPTENSSVNSPTPENQAALTGKSPSGSSSSGTTVPASSGDLTSDKKNPSASDVTTQSSDVAAQPSETAQPPGGTSPAVGDPLKNPSQSDAEKAAKIAEAKAKAAAAKQAIGDKAAPAQPATVAGSAPKAPVKKKEEGPKPTDAANHPLVKKIADAFAGATLEASEFIGQLSIRVDGARIVEICAFLKRDAETSFNFLSDLTAVHFPERTDAPFDIVYQLYSLAANERVRLKVSVNGEEGIESVTSVWPTANWMEREVFDLFGIPFRNHPDLRRILLPPDWEGYPLRKEYPLEFMENNWTAKHLPEFTGVQQEQLAQRRAYGLEILSTPAERRVREIFRAGKEVMPLDRK
jgi:NADH-quinone oxidoreductase subunit C